MEYYRENRNVLYLGNANVILKALPDKSVDLVLTDPPYGVNSDEMNGVAYKDRFYDVDLVSKELFRVLKPNSRALVFTAQKTYCTVVDAFQNNGFKLHQTLIWVKRNLASPHKFGYEFTSNYEMILNFHKGKVPRLNGKGNTDVLIYSAPQSNFSDKRMHVHQKPINLIVKLLDTVCNGNCTVLDPFAGSGTTLVGAKKLGLNWIGIEIQKDYCDITVERLKSVPVSLPLY